mmetsp:Transcript_712/g.2373  ORF Transcript_712/g.2373 Transcript_712/m.2373 type:complete len:126 (+) Transcript_712:199-576(+)
MVIRMNRDTLYSAAVIDLAGGPAKVTLPESPVFMSLMPISQDHDIFPTIYANSSSPHVQRERHWYPVPRAHRAHLCGGGGRGGPRHSQRAAGRAEDRAGRHGHLRHPPLGYREPRNHPRCPQGSL